MHAANRLDKSEILGQKAVDLEVARVTSEVSRRSSIVHEENQDVGTVARFSLGPLGGDPGGVMLGRTSGGVTRLPPPTL